MAFLFYEGGLAARQLKNVTHVSSRHPVKF